MATNAHEIKRRIRSWKNMQQITKAMKMVSAAKLRKAQERVVQARPYADKIAEVVSNVAQAGGGRHPMMEKREIKKIAFVVITSDRGLAGGYNAQVLRFAMSRIQELQQGQYTVFAVGRKGRDFFSKRRIPIQSEVVGLSDFPTFVDIKRVTEAVVQAYQEGVVDEVHLIFNKFLSPISQVPTSKQLLPMEKIEDQSTAKAAASTAYLYEPSAEEVLDTLLPKYIETLIYSALLEAKASEHGARMTAMGNATDNAGELISSLTLELNRARQAAITTQISEIVGGAAALD